MSTTFNTEDPSDVGLLELWEERVAVRQYDGEHDEKRAKLLAGFDVKRMQGLKALPKWLVKLAMSP
jgi:hypothetical protein